MTDAAAGTAFDAVAAADYLTRLFFDAPGRLQIAYQDAHGRFHGDRGDVATVTEAVMLARARHEAGARSIYLRACTLGRELDRGERGEATDSLALPGLWSDVDYGEVGHAHDPEKHDGRPLPPDAESAAVLVTESGLPEPSLWVHSGGGWYCWWLLDAPIVLTDENRADITEMSSAWQAALRRSAHAHGWEYGAGVGDLARVLRMVGSVNRKTDDERPCTLIEDTGRRYTVDELRGALDALPARETGTVPEQVPQPAMRPRATTVVPAGESAFDLLDEHVGFDDLLTGAGWSKHRSTHSPAVDECWTRPGDPDNPCSAHTLRENPHALVVWSEAAGLPTGGGQRLTRGRLFAHLHHGGDTTRAAVDLFAAMGGRPCTPAAAALPLPRQETRTPALVAEASRESGQDGETSDPQHETPVTSLAHLCPPHVWGEPFWQARPILAHVHAFALSRMVAPSAVLGAVLLRFADLIPPSLVLPPTIGGVASLNAFVAIVGPSGSGKGAAHAAADDAFRWPRPIFRTPPASGEGLAHAFAHTENRPKSEGGGLHQVPDRTAVQFEVSEIDTFAGAGGRKGSTLDSTLRSVYSGERLGGATASRERRLNLEPHSYRATMIVATQPERAGALFVNAEGGTPQRFVWLPAISAEVTAEPPEALEPLPVRLPTWPVHSLEGRPRFALPGSVETFIRGAHAARQRGEGHKLDGHAILTRTKVAAVFAVMDGRINVTEHDWALAGAVMALSDATRECVVATLREVAEQSEVARGRAEGLRQHTAEVTRSDLTSAKLLDRLRGWIEDAGAEGTTRSALRRRLNSRERDELDPALVRLAPFIDQHAEGRRIRSVRFAT